ncbi:MAG: winged helix-turn-helix domain-containing protein [Actinobacteria bacterium]|nr:winged helix-turn-helix domain-containing protein [Actinomycetota bacterium]
MNVTLFGPLQVTDGNRTLRGADFGGQKPRGLLELLLLARGRTVSKEQLADQLWGDAPPRNVAGTLEHYVCVLRRRLSDDQQLARRILVTESGAYRFGFDEVDVDIDRFDRLVLQAEYADDATCRRLLGEAVAIVGGDLLDDAPYAPWAAPERDLYRSRVARAHLWLGRDAVLTGAHSSAVRHGEAALRFAPYSEEAFRIIMIADHALGHADLARLTHLRCRQTLSECLSVDPTTETENVATAIDGGMPATDLIEAFARRTLGVMLAAA